VHAQGMGGGTNDAGARDATQSKALFLQRLTTYRRRLSHGCEMSIAVEDGSDSMVLQHTVCKLEEDALWLSLNGTQRAISLAHVQVVRDYGQFDTQIPGSQIELLCEIPVDGAQSSFSVILHLESSEEAELLKKWLRFGFRVLVDQEFKIGASCAGS